MKCLCIGDVHIKVNNVPESEEMTKKLVELCEKTKPNFIVLLGDILDRHSTIHVHCLMRCETLVLSLSKFAPTFVLVGNHDRPNNSNFLTDEHPFNAMKLWENVYIVDQPLDVKIKETENLFEGVNTEEGDRFIFLPYVPPGRLKEAISRIDDPYLGTRAFFAHQEIKGAKMGAIVSTEGDEWDLDLPLLISGHVHDYDRLQPNMIYTGTPLMHGFGDKSDKTVSFFTFEEKSWEEERIDLGLIKKVTIYISPEEVSAYQPPKDKLVKLVISGEESFIKAVAKLDKINELKKEGVKVVFKTAPTKLEKTEYLPKMSYGDRLKKEIRYNLRADSWYNKLF